ncbi:hypothetical protein CTTA_3263 [Comamonas testosteroni]|uniref:DUF3577 domain-containing protein n=1 Tax=Comamonas testosteroni TaxID=285 RepID=A0A5A7MEH2_COMTE|nr:MULTISPECIES: DUF3577 domain-containing protein [Comamonas]UBQ39704.1 DUF3577 domain-containing protein [Comamonas thiooxydans]WQG65553.1 DUF3577 domain-containing protein [Comamonas testosteroni]GEQ76258.1 hypothetical protein CTTA_3263 [Comamonas testosteroni]
MQQQQAPAQREFFNLHANGIGYLSRVRWVTPTGRGRKAEPFLACAISALRGAADSPDYTYFDLRVSSAEAIELIESLQKEVDERRKVLISFRIADLYAHPYERDERDQKGRPTGKKELAGLIKGRLILVNSVRVDGQLVYQRAESNAEAAHVGSQPQGDEAFYDDHGVGSPEQGGQDEQPHGPAPQERAQAPAPRQQPQYRAPAPQGRTPSAPTRQPARSGGYGSTPGHQRQGGYADRREHDYA